ncbi:hypothetical protein AAHE18_03G096300 [Arachis hypogaea]
MAISEEASSALEAPLLLDTDDTVNGAIDYKGRPSIRSQSGSWRSARFIIGVEVAERVGFYGIQGNLISYLTGPLQQSTAAAAENVNIWSGASSLLSLFGAIVADSYLGRYRTIILASLGIGSLTISAMLPSLNNPECQVGSKLGSCATETQVILFFISLYLVAIAQGGHKSCVQAFGADQFDEQHPKEFKDRSSFFNWWYFTMCAGSMGTLWILNYIQDNLSWVVGFGIPSARNRQAETIQEETSGTLPPQISQQFNFLNKALLAPDCSIKEGNVTCSVVEVEEAKAVLRLVPIWATTLPFATVFAQAPTFFTKQGFTLDRTILCLLLCLLKPLPAASLQTLIALAIVVISPIYDRIFVPIARAITRQILRHHNATKNWDWDFYIDI